MPAVLWDVGGVLVTFADGASGRVRWREHLALREGELERRLWEAIGTAGSSETKLIVERLMSSLSLSRSDASALLFDAHEHWRPNRELLDKAIELRQAGHPAAIVANAGRAARWAFEELLRVGEFADVVVISAEVNLEKPDPAIYRLTASSLGVAPERCVFIDDLPENVAGAETIGIDVIQHVGNQSTIEALADRL
jgi:HAD superfamily hydrolase (TIGR01509 family)